MMRPRSPLSHLLRAVGVLFLTTVPLAHHYRRQIRSYLTHWKGSPARTVPYRPHTIEPRLRVAVAGDIGARGDRVDAVGRAMAVLARDDPYDVLLLLGDNSYPSGDPKHLPSTVYQPFATVLRNARLLAILGNHDVERQHGSEQIAALGMNGPWWAEQIEDILFVGLDSNRPEDGQQLEFLERTLASARVRWTIVALHHPPYSAGYQGSSREVRSVFSPIFERYDVPLVLSGHDHDYQRSLPINGVTYIVSGGAARTRRTGAERFTAESFSGLHFVDLAIFEDRLVGRAVNRDGRVADTFVLRPSGAAHLASSLSN